MNSGRDGDHGGPNSGGGESGELPPQAPAYDLRTGQPLDRPQDPFASGSGPDDDDLGIWAPGQQEPENEKDAGPDYGATSASGAAGTYAHPAPERTTVQAPQQDQGQYGQPPYGQVEYGQVGYRQPSYGPTSSGPATYPGYGPPGTNPTLTGPGPGRGPERPRRGVAVLGGVVGVLVVAVAVLVTVLLVRGSSDNKEPTASTVPGASTAPSAGASSGSGNGTSNGGTNSSGGTGSTGSSSARAAFVRDVDAILTQSADGRAQVASAVNGVNNGCSVSPSSAADTMQQVIDNRQSVLAQANALSAPDSATATAKANLVQALQASIEANRGYLQWFEDLQGEFPDASPAGCPGGQAPTNISYDEATAASGRATSAKQSFVAGYNPLATSAGQRTWSESEF